MKKFTCLAGGMMAAFGACAGWFDAGIQNYESWPTDGGDKIVDGVGRWSGTDGAALVGETGAKSLQVDAAEPLMFDVAEQKSVTAEGAEVGLSMTVRPSVGKDLPAVPEDAKGAIFVLDEGSVTNCWGLVSAADGPSNVWVRLAGASPYADTDAVIDMRCRLVGEQLQVRYAINGVALLNGSAEWSPIACPDGISAVVGCGFLGRGSVSVLTGDYTDSTPKATLTIPSLDHVTVAHVKVAGAEVKPTDEGAYVVNAGSVVTVTFAPDPGWAIDVAAMTFVVGQDMTLPETGRPQAINVSAVVTINEIMAKNGTTLRTETGFEGLDWVELYNRSDSDVDMTGWYFGNDPTKKTSKWTAIEGSCVVPANGYKILWCDGDGLCTNWAADEAHVACNISTDAGKHTLFLAAEADANTIVQQIKLPGGMKDVSYGRGHLSAELARDMFVYFEQPTPGAANDGNGRTGFTPKVAFGEPHGYKDAPFDLALSCPDNETAVIYYTLDGTSPKVGGASTFRYASPIHIDKTTVVRAAVPDADSILQVDASATYLFFDDIVQQDAKPPEGFPENGTVNGQRMLYGLAEAVTEGDADTQARLKRGFTESIRTVSLVIDPKCLFDKASGIYVNATNDGRDWERQTMAEQINPANPADEFSVSAGLRIRGAFSRNAKCPKHSFRLFFRSEYGMGTLKHPLFGDEGTDEFEKIDLRTSQDYSWANNDDGDTFIHECFSRDSEGAMGKTHNRSRYYNLFINGVYWGLYQTEERVDQNYCESYNGGAADNYDVVRTSQPGYKTGVVEGESAAWTNLWRITTQEGYGEGHAANYNRVRGLNADGTRNADYPVLLNVTNLVEYILTVHYTEDKDSPVNKHGMVNNINAFRNRHDGEGKEDGFLWNRHDAEMSMRDVETFCSLVYGTPEHTDAEYDLSELPNFNPSRLNYELLKNAEYRCVFGDLVYRHMLRTGGAMTVPVADARFRARMAEIDDAIVCESARWGHQYSTKRTRATWLADCSNCLNFITNRLTYLIAEYRRRGWYPSVDAPGATNGSGDPVADGATIAATDRLFLTGGGAGTVYYTLDGSDPRMTGGAIAAGAQAYSDGLVVPPEGAKVTMRVRSGAGEWSALSWVSVKGELPKADPAEALRLAAAMTSAEGGDDTLDFLVITNVTAGEVSLEGVKVVAWNAKKKSEAEPSLTYVFGAGENLLPGAALTLPASAFKTGDKLTNGQVGLRLYTADAALIQDVFLDAGWWNGACDGTGEHFVAKTFGAEAKTHADWMPTATGLAGKLAVLELYTSTTGDGDTGEFVVLTNLDAKAALDLTDVALVAWNAKKKSEAEPSLTVKFDGLAIPAGGAVTVDQATYFGDGKLTNGKVGLKLYDAAATCAQEVGVDADWWNKACDGTGASFLALEFGATVTDVAQWTAKSPAPMDWPADPDKDITETTKPADLGITEGAFADAKPEELRKLAKWAKANDVVCGGIVVNSMSFDADGNPATEIEAAYLLNCPVLEVESAKTAFRFSAIVPGVQPEIDGSRYNGQITVYGTETLDGLWSTDLPTARFYKAVLTR